MATHFQRLWYTTDQLSGGRERYKQSVSVAVVHSSISFLLMLLQSFWLFLSSLLWLIVKIVRTTADTRSRGATFQYHIQQLAETKALYLSLFPTRNRTRRSMDERLFRIRRTTRRNVKMVEAVAIKSFVVMTRKVLSIFIEHLACALGGHRSTLPIIVSPEVGAQTDPRGNEQGYRNDCHRESIATVEGVCMMLCYPYRTQCNPDHPISTY